MKVDAKRRRKGQLKMRALADEVRRFSDVCSSVQGSIVSNAALELAHIDPVINSLDNALVAIRTLDKEVFEASDPSGYQTLRQGRLGNVVRALTPPRNNAVHHADVVDPDLARAIGPLDNGLFIIFPRWKQRANLPAEMFQYSNGKTKGKNNTGYISSYDSGAAGRPVLDTILDAFLFFERCDPSIPNRDSAGRLEGFPLPPLPVAGYRRLSPEWPDHAEVDERIRSSICALVPYGERRHIRGLIRTPSGPVYCGYTTIDATSKHSFTEPVEQIHRDVDLGYAYAAPVAGRDVDVTVRGGELMAGADLLVDVDLRDWTLSASEPWAGWWELCSVDADFYRRQRQPR